MDSDLAPTINNKMEGDMFMKSIILASLFCFGILYISHSSSAEQGVLETGTESEDVCPDGFDVAYEVVARYLSSDGLADMRQEAGTSGISVDNVRLLVDGEDEEACQALDTLYGDYRGGEVRDVAYYEAGGFYFVPDPLITHEVGGMIIASGHHYLYVVNSDFEQIQALMM